MKNVLTSLAKKRIH